MPVTVARGVSYCAGKPICNSAVTVFIFVARKKTAAQIICAAVFFDRAQCWLVYYLAAGAGVAAGAAGFASAVLSAFFTVLCLAVLCLAACLVPVLAASALAAAGAGVAAGAAAVPVWANTGSAKADNKAIATTDFEFMVIPLKSGAP